MLVRMDTSKALVFSALMWIVPLILQTQQTFSLVTYFQSWVCSSYCFDNVPVADTVGRQRKNISLLWNKSVYGQAERSCQCNALTATAETTWRLYLAADCRDFSAMLWGSAYLAKTTFFQAEVMPDTFIYSMSLIIWPKGSIPTPSVNRKVLKAAVAMQQLQKPVGDFLISW